MNITDEEIRRRANEVFSAMEKRSTLEEMQMIHRAFDFACEAHRDQRRKTGEPYIIHPIAVAMIAASELQLGAAPVCAAFLHDVVEDTPCTNEKIRDMFGDDVAFLVRVVTKQKKRSYDMSKQLDNFKQMLDSMHNDIRAILIKLADRLHNMRTLDSMRPDKQMKIAGETDYFYAPLANRLGFYTIKVELENLSFRFRCPDVYQYITELVEKEKERENAHLQAFESRIDSILRSEGIQFYREVEYKQPYNIWRKMQTTGQDFEHLEGRHFTRIVFPEDMYLSRKNMCLKIYSLLTDQFKERPNSIVNYVDQPKQNGYQAFHLQVLSDYGVWEEIHIQSEKMRTKSKLGYLFDSGQREIDINKWLDDFRKVMKDVADHPEQNKDGTYFMQSVKASFYNDDIQVYTPEGKAVLLPKSSSAIDFAFDIHTEVGMHAKYAKINGHLASIKTKLKRGDSVEIGTAPEVATSEDLGTRYLAQQNAFDKAEREKRRADSNYEKRRFVLMAEWIPCVIDSVLPDNAAALAGMQKGDSIVAVDYQSQPEVVYPATVTLKAVDRQHLLSDIIDSISNKLHLSINDLHTVTEDEIVTTTINFFIHDYMELRTVVSSILSIPDVDEVSYLNK